MQRLNSRTFFWTQVRSKLAKKINSDFLAKFVVLSKQPTETRSPRRAQRLHEKPAIRIRQEINQEDSGSRMHPVDAWKTSKVDFRQEHFQSHSRTRRDQERGKRMHESPQTKWTLTNRDINKSRRARQSNQDRVTLHSTTSINPHYPNINPTSGHLELKFPASLDTGSIAGAERGARSTE